MKYKSVILALLSLLICMAADLQSAQSAENMTQSHALPYPKSEIRIACPVDSPPYFFREDGEIKGFAIDFWRLWSEKTGISLEFIPGTWADTIDMVQKGEADAHAGLFYSEERDVLLDFVVPVVRVDNHFFFHKSIFGLKTLEDLAGFKIGLVKGGYSEGYVRKYLTDAAIALYLSFPDMLDAAIKGEIRVFMESAPPILWYLRQRGMTDEFRFHQENPFSSLLGYAAVRQGNTGLAQAIIRGNDKITNEEKARVQKKWLGISSAKTEDTLVIAMDRDYTPMIFLNTEGNPAGLLADIWRLWAEKTGQKIEFRTGTWKDSLDSLKSGNADIHSGLFFSNTRAQWADFSQPFYEAESYFFYSAKTSELFKSSEISGFAGKKIGVILGAYQEAYLRKNYPKAEIITFTSREKMIRESMNGDITAFLTEYLSMTALLSRLGLSGELIANHKALLTNKFHAGVLKGNQSLLSLVDKGLNAISNEELAEIEKHWIPDPAKQYYQTNKDIVRLSRKEKEWIRSHGRILVGLCPDCAPAVFSENGNLVGIVPDHLRVITEQTGIHFELIPVAASDSLNAAKAHEIDMFLGIENPERSHFMNFTAPIISQSFVIINQRNDSFVKDMKSLSGKKIAVVKDMIFYQQVLKDYPDIKTYAVKDHLEALKSVLNGRADAYVGPIAVATYMIQKHALNHLKIAAMMDSPEIEFGFAVRNDWNVLTRIMNKAIASVSDDEVDKIHAKWITIRSQNVIDWDIIIPWILASFLVIFVTLLWNRRLAKETLAHKQTEHRLRTITEKAPDFIFELDRRGTILFINRSLGGYSLYEATGENLKDWVLAEYHSTVDQALETVFSKAIACEYEVRGFGPHKNIRWYIGKINPVIIENEVRSAILIARDITEYKQTRELLHESEQKYRELVENANSIILRATPEWNIIFFNAFAQKFFGYAEDEILGKSVMETIVPESESTGRDLRDMMQDIAYHPEKYRYNENENICKDGTRVWVAWTNKVIAGENGNPLEVLCIGNDITDRRCAEESLKNRLRYEQGLAECSRVLLTQTSARMEKAMTHLLRAANVSRVYIFENFEDIRDGLCMRQTYEVCAPGIRPEIDNPILQHVPYQDDFFRWRQALSSGNPIAGAVASFPQEERDILESQHILSILVLPIYVDSEWYGFIGFDDTFQEREWKKEDIQLLGMAAETLGRFIEQRRTRKELIRNQQFLKNILMAIQDGIVVLDNDFNVLLVNPFFEKVYASEMPIVGKNVTRSHTEIRTNPAISALLQRCFSPECLRWWKR